MENGWSLFNTTTTTATTSTTCCGNRGQNGHYSNIAWDIWELGGTSRFDWSSNGSTTATDPGTAYPEASAHQALMLAHPAAGRDQGNAPASVYAGAGPHCLPDPHLTCLKLGKRDYFEDAAAQLSAVATKRGRPYDYYGFGSGGGGGVVIGPSSATVPRCQVEGCQVALVDAKDYHRRHKVCEMHSKAPRVVVLGLEQRFCQQCSRFHAVSEFDDSKRSCRRRLAGHNERRRKGSHDSIPRDPSQGRAHSLLSFKNNPWFSTADLSSRSSIALHELIAENRASILARQLILERDWHRFHHTTQEDINSTQPGSNSMLTSHHQIFPEQHSWDRYNEGAGHVTLDLMQASKEEQEQCSELWRSLGGAHLV